MTTPSIDNLPVVFVASPVRQDQTGCCEVQACQPAHESYVLRALLLLLLLLESRHIHPWLVSSSHSYDRE